MHKNFRIIKLVAITTLSAFCFTQLGLSAPISPDKLRQGNAGAAGSRTAGSIGRALGATDTAPQSAAAIGKETAIIMALKKAKVQKKRNLTPNERFDIVLSVFNEKLSDGESRDKFLAETLNSMQHLISIKPSFDAAHAKSIIWEVDEKLTREQDKKLLGYAFFESEQQAQLAKAFAYLVPELAYKPFEDAVSAILIQAQDVAPEIYRETRQNNGADFEGIKIRLRPKKIEGESVALIILRNRKNTKPGFKIEVYSGRKRLRVALITDREASKAVIQRAATRLLNQTPAKDWLVSAAAAGAAFASGSSVEIMTVDAATQEIVNRIDNNAARKVDFIGRSQQVLYSLVALRDTFLPSLSSPYRDIAVNSIRQRVESIADLSSGSVTVTLLDDGSVIEVAPAASANMAGVNGTQQLITKAKQLADVSKLRREGVTSVVVNLGNGDRKILGMDDLALFVNAGQIIRLPDGRWSTMSSAIIEGVVHRDRKGRTYFVANSTGKAEQITELLKAAGLRYVSQEAGRGVVLDCTAPEGEKELLKLILINAPRGAPLGAMVETKTEENDLLAAGKIAASVENAGDLPATLEAVKSQLNQLDITKYSIYTLQDLGVFRKCGIYNYIISIPQNQDRIVIMLKSILETVGIQAQNPDKLDEALHAIALEISV